MANIAKLKQDIAFEESNLLSWKEQEKYLAEQDMLGEEAMVKDITNGIADAEASLAKLRDDLAKAEATLPAPEKPKYSRENHPAFKGQAEEALNQSQAQADDTPTVYKVGDVVEAKWTDRLWYKAKISSTMGSSADPQYTVRFVDYKDSMLTVNRFSIRPLLSETKKRKADGTPAGTSAAFAQNPAVISAAPTFNGNDTGNNGAPLATVNKVNGTDDAAQPKKKRKRADNSALRANMKNWHDFQKKGPKGVQKESQFRTGNAVGARVGFTGSGTPMTKDAPRKKHVFKHRDDGEQGG